MAYVTAYSDVIEKWQQLLNDGKKQEATDFLVPYLRTNGQTLSKYIMKWDAERRDPKIKFKNVYMYMLTFTINPEWHELNDATYDKIEAYIRKLPFNEKWNTLCCGLVREGSDEDDLHTHWHMLLVTSKYFKKYDCLRWYRKTYGIANYKDSTTKDLNHTIKYMSKQNEIDYLIGRIDTFLLDPIRPNESTTNDETEDETEDEIYHSATLEEAWDRLDKVLDKI